MPRHLRIEPAHAIRPNDKIRRMKLVRLYKFQDASIHLRALGLHHVENESQRSVAALLHDAECRIVAVGDALNSDLAFQDAVGIIQHRINGMSGVSVARQFEQRRTRPDPVPTLRDWTLIYPFPLERHFSPCPEICRRAAGLQCS